MMSTMLEYTVTERKGKGYKATIIRPILSEEERLKREAVIRSALVQYGRERMSKHGKQNNS